MAITENTFTADELKGALNTNKELLKVVLPVLKEQKLSIYDETEHAAFVQKTQDAASLVSVNKTTSDIYSAIDADIEKHIGIKKEHNEEKTYDYLKRAASSLTKQITDLNGKIKAGANDTVLKEQFEASQLEVTKYKGISEKLEKDIQVAEIRSDVDQALTGVAFRADYPDILVRPTINAIKDTLIQGAKKVDGKIIYHGADGKAILKGTEIAKASDILMDQLKDLIDVERTQTGSGTKPPTKIIGKSTGVKNKDQVEIVVSDTIKTKVELHEYLGKQGLSSNSEEFIKIDEQYKDLPLK